MIAILHRRNVRPFVVVAALVGLAVGYVPPGDSTDSGLCAISTAHAAPNKPPKRKSRRGKRSETAAPQPAPADAAADVPLRRSNRIDFDARLIRGQTPGAGAVYLFHRAPRRLPPLVRVEPDMLDRIVRPILGRGVRPAAAPRPAK